ncbi:septation protein SepH, partial [Actinomadura kijaniata]|uniref:septation protein SepH n=1 Tax=Actinomadura kijaniata TaxID=46161 RepID=UPI003F1D5DBC
MQELRLVAVSEDGTYLVLATAGRGTRFTLPVDDRLRAAVRGHFSRLGQFEIEVESPLRPKEIQARIRSGETAEEIAESAGIPVERVRWFEGPVLQEREYMAQQAQRVAVRRPGESTPGPPLGETVEERLGRGGIDLEEVEWDSWKCENSTWRVRLSFFEGGRPHAAEWVFDPRRRLVSPLDEVAARLTAVEWEDDTLSDTVTPLVPRRPAMKVVSDNRPEQRPEQRAEQRPAPARGIPAEAEHPGEPGEAQREARREASVHDFDAREYIVERGRMVDPRPFPARDLSGEPPMATPRFGGYEPEREERPEPAAEAAEAPRPAPVPKPKPEPVPEPVAAERPEPAPEPAAEEPAPAAEEAAGNAAETAAEPVQAVETAEAAEPEEAPAAAEAGEAPAEECAEAASEAEAAPEEKAAEPASEEAPEPAAAPEEVGEPVHLHERAGQPHHGGPGGG